MQVRLFRIVCPLVLLVLLSLSLQRNVAASDINVACDEAEMVNAINAANALPDADTLHLSAGCYYVFDFASDIDGTLGDSALPRITTPITIEGNGAILLGPGWDSAEFRLLHVAKTGNLLLNNIRIDRGSSTEGGGGILNNGGTLTLTSCAIGDNTAASFGGGIYSTAGSTLTVSNCTFTGNSSAGGGGIRNDGIMTVTQSMLTANTVNGSGGGIANGLEGVATITNSTVASNSSTGANFGGGIANIGTLTVVDVVLSGNSGTNPGGGLGNSLGSATIINSTISGNSATNGGGIYKFNGTVNIINSTIASNNAANGGGIDNASGSAVMITNSILYANSSQIAGAATAIYSNIQGGFGSTGNLTVDPLFVSPVDFASAPTTVGNYHLQPNSPVIDKGDTALLPADTTDLDGDGDTTELLPIDRDGEMRALGASVDMGADENGGCAAYAFPYTIAAGDSAALMNAIVCANVYPDTNTIILSSSAYSYNNTWDIDAQSGGTALPAITTPIIIQGNNATIKRADGSPYLRLLHVTTSGNLSLNNVTVSGGYTYNAVLGGGSNGGNILNDGGILNIRNSTITRSVGLVGGAIYSTGTTTLIDSTVTDSNAVDGGGGIRSNNSTLAIINSRIAGNGTNDRGGGISSNDSELTVINSQLTGNGANLKGGAFYSVGDVLTVINSTIAGNAAGSLDPLTSGGGIYGENSTLNVTNSIVWGNSMQINTVGGTATVAHSIVESGFSGTGNLDVDPLFVAPLSYTVAASWPTADGDYHLQADSPAMNTGNSAALPPDTYDIDSDSNTTEPLPIDIDGDWRILDGVVDMGADEASGCTAYTFPYTVAAGDTTELVQAIRCANANPDESVINLTESTYNFIGASEINASLGDSALPRITTPIVINGNGATLQRAGGAPAFRLLYITNNGNLTLDNVKISGGQTTSNGGGILNEAGTLTVTNSSLTGNHADNFGGGIYIEGGTVMVANSTLSSNSATSTGGGIAGGSFSATVTVIDSILSENSAASGGAIAGLYTLSLINNTITGNTASNSGGGLVLDNANATVVNNLITGNNANVGGGISMLSSSVTLTSSTITGNNANVGGSIYNTYSTLTITNSIVWGNSTEISTEISGTTTVTYSTVEGGYAGVGNIDVDPLFVSPVPHTSTPATTGDYHVQANSPTIDVGDNVSVPADTQDLDGDGNTIEMIPYDRENNPRIVNGMVNMGAYEHITFVIVSATSVSTTEGTVPSTYTIMLASEPTGDVTITPIGDEQCSVSNPLIFTATNWEIGQSVAVMAVEDSVVEGVHTCTISHSATSVDLGYEGINIANVTGNIIDNDVANVKVIPTTVSVEEASATDTYTVVLTSEPTAEVEITITGDAECSISPELLAFTADSWNIPQEITVTAVNDAEVEGSHSCTVSHTAASADTDYKDIQIANVTAIITDNDTVSVMIDPLTVAVEEGGATGAYSVVLTSAPTTSVIVTSASDSQCSVNDALIFTSDDWMTPQSVTVTAVDDQIVEGNHTCTIISAAASSDLDYNGVSIASIDVTITDNDMAGVIVSEPTVHVTEGGAASTYTVVLTSKPASDVTITAAADEQCAISAPVTFTNTDWDMPQSIAITAVDDQELEGTHTCNVMHSATSLDPNYDGITIPVVTVSITDNELNLLTNGDFEVYDGNKLPDSWTVKYPAGDKVKCNTLDKTVAFTGECAFKFKGGPGEKAKLILNVSLGGITFSQNDTLSLSAHFQGSNTAVKATFILNVKYVGNPVPVKVKTPIGRNTVYTEISVPDLSIGAGVIQQIKVIIKHNSTAGKLFVDAATLSLANGPVVRSNVLPQPEAPDGFRGDN